MQKSKLQFKIQKLFVDSDKFVGSDRKQGFTLIETMVALAIFSVSVVSLIVMTSQGVANVSLAKNKLIASYLAQEGIEVVRNNRDSNGWPPTVSDNLQDSVYFNGTITPFSRNITITIPVGSNNDEVKITSVVSWQQGQGLGKSVTYSENLFNWHWQ